MSYLRLFTFITLLASSTISLFASAALDHEVMGGDSDSAVGAGDGSVSVDMSATGDETASVGSAWTLATSGGASYTPPTLTSGMSLKQVVTHFKALRAEYTKSVRQIATQQRNVREFIDAQLAILSEIEGVVARADGASARVVLETSIARLVEAHKALQRKEATAQAECRRLGQEVATLRAHSAALEKDLGELRARMTASATDPLLGGDDDRDSSCCSKCCVQ